MNLHQKYSREKNELVLHYMELRRAIGYLGVALPVMLFIGNSLILSFKSGALHWGFEPSISDFYHTRVGDLFVGILCFVAIFLMAYKGEEVIDNVLTTIAGSFAFCVAILPTSFKGEIHEACRSLFPAFPYIIGAIHLLCAASFFLILTIMSYFLFPRTDKPEETWSRARIIRKRLFKTCGIVMFICMLGMVLVFVVPGWKEKGAEANAVFWLETFALWAFGISWLTKGEALPGTKEHRTEKS